MGRPRAGNPVDKSRRVARFFDETSTAFDAIYRDANPVARAFNRLTRRDIYDRFEITMRECSPAKGATVLDVGCGSGQYALALARRGARVIGVDMSSRMIRLADGATRSADVRDRVALAVADAMDLVPRRQFTYVIALGVFDYVADAAAFLGHLARFAEQKVVASFPKRWFPRSQWRSFRYGLRNCPVYFYSEAEVRVLGDLLEPRAQRLDAIPGPGYDYVLTVDV